MGQWVVIVQGIGPHHNNQPYDVDSLANAFVHRLREAGQVVTHATVTIGGNEPLAPQGAEQVVET